MTPLGRPASRQISPNARAVTQASSDGFNTTALPIANAPTTDLPIICIG